MQKLPAASKITFGATNPAEYRNKSGDFLWFPQAENKAWRLEVWDIKMDNTSFDDGKVNNA